MQYRQMHTGQSYEQQVIGFIQAYELKYLFVTRDFSTVFLTDLIQTQVQDANTGERFLVLRS
jgi:hypothetical protein